MTWEKLAEYMELYGKNPLSCDGSQSGENRFYKGILTTGDCSYILDYGWVAEDDSHSFIAIVKRTGKNIEHVTCVKNNHHYMLEEILTLLETQGLDSHPVSYLCSPTK